MGRIEVATAVVGLAWSGWGAVLGRCWAEEEGGVGGYRTWTAEKRQQCIGVLSVHRGIEHLDMCLWNQ